MGFIPWDGMIEKYERRGWTIMVREGADDARVKLEGHTLASPPEVQSSGYGKTMVAVVVTVEDIKA